MHRISCSLTLLLLLIILACTKVRSHRVQVGAARAAGVTARPSAAPQTDVQRAPVPLETFLDIRRVGGASFSYDEKWIAYFDDRGGRPDVWIQPISGGTAKQITHVNGFVHSLAFSPVADLLLYEADQGGNELPHLYLTDHTGAAHSDLTADYPEGARTAFMRWAEDGHAFFFLSNWRDPKYFDIYEYDIAKKAAQLLWQASGKFRPVLVSSDGKRFVILEIHSDVDDNLYLWQRGTKRLDLLTPHQGEALFFAEAFSRDGRLLYYVSNQAREFAALYQLDLASKRSEPVLSAPRDVEGAGFSEGWTYFSTATNVDGTPRVVARKGVRGEAVAMPSLGGDGALVPISFSKSDRYVGATRITDTAPIELYVADLHTGRATKLTEALPEPLRSYRMVAGESIRVPSFDGTVVPAFVYRPVGTGPFPAVIDVHGGPTSQSRRLFDPWRQYLVSKGYVVLVSNVRGSTGYGKSYKELDNLDFGGGPLQDVVWCKKWLTEHAQVDPKRVVVLGYSYGGYMALAAATFTPGQFAAQIDYFGVSDLKSFLQDAPPYWASDAGYFHKKFGDANNPAHAQYLHDRSPIHFVDAIRTPLLVVQGENDPRVHKDQSDNIVERLKQRGVPVDYLVIPGEGHGFSKNENLVAALRATDRFLDRYILGDRSGKAMEP